MSTHLFLQENTELLLYLFNDRQFIESLKDEVIIALPHMLVIFQQYILIYLKEKSKIGVPIKAGLTVADLKWNFIYLNTRLCKMSTILRKKKHNRFGLRYLFILMIFYI